MISPDIKDLMRNMDSRYTLVVTAAKRARQLTGGAEPLTRFRSDKPVTLAIHEIAEGKVDYFRDVLSQQNDGYGDGGAMSRYRGRGNIHDRVDSGGYTTGIFDDDDGYGDDMSDSRSYGGRWSRDADDDRIYDRRCESGTDDRDAAIGDDELAGDPDDPDDPESGLFTEDDGAGAGSGFGELANDADDDI